MTDITLTAITSLVYNTAIGYSIGHELVNVTGNIAIVETLV